MANLITELLPIAVLASHALLVFGVLAYVFRNSWGARTMAFVKEKGILLGAIVSLLTVLGSLFYSSIIGFPPCLLCWWQRVFLFPTLVLFAVALVKKDRGVFKYVLPLAVLAGSVALYQTYTDFGGTSLLECTDEAGDCSKIYVKEFSYITIPVMGLTSALYLIFLSVINRKNV